MEALSLTSVNKRLDPLVCLLSLFCLGTARKTEKNEGLTSSRLKHDPHPQGKVQWKHFTKSARPPVHFTANIFLFRPIWFLSKEDIGPKQKRRSLIKSKSWWWGSFPNFKPIWALNHWFSFIFCAGVGLSGNLTAGLPKKKETIEIVKIPRKCSLSRAFNNIKNDPVFRYSSGKMTWST